MTNVVFRSFDATIVAQYAHDDFTSVHIRLLILCIFYIVYMICSLFVHEVGECEKEEERETALIINAYNRKL